MAVLQPRHHASRSMEGEQDSRKRKLAALKARREQGNLANAALADKEEARFVRYFVISLLGAGSRVSFVPKTTSLPVSLFPLRPAGCDVGLV